MSKISQALLIKTDDDNYQLIANVNSLIYKFREDEYFLENFRLCLFINGKKYFKDFSLNEKMIIDQSFFDDLKINKISKIYVKLAKLKRNSKFKYVYLRRPVLFTFLPINFDFYTKKKNVIMRINYYTKKRNLRDFKYIYRSLEINDHKNNNLTRKNEVDLNKIIDKYFLNENFDLYFKVRFFIKNKEIYLGKINTRKYYSKNLK